MYLRTDYQSFLDKCLLHYGFRLVRASNENAPQDASSSANAVKK